MKAPRKVFATFTSDEILRESGRLPFALLHPFVAAGFEVVVYDKLRDRLTSYYKCAEGELPQTAGLSLSMKGVSYSGDIPDDCADSVYLFDDPLESAWHRPWRRRIRVRFDTFSPYRLRAPVIAPYSMHPAQAQLATQENLGALRRTPRRLRVLFAGDSNGYVRNRVRHPGPKLPRLEVLNTLRQRMLEDLICVSGAEDIDRLCRTGFANKFILSESGSGIEPAQWLPTLATADFFLCPPGMVMPMCHNVVEAMAVGAIPLISYPEWFHPNLTNMTNCLVFDGEDDLVEKMRLALAMPDAQVARMRAGVIAYYERHLRPEVVVAAIEARTEREVTLLLHTELNMAKNAKKLSRNSILIKGPGDDGPLRTIGRVFDRFNSALLLSH